MHTPEVDGVYNVAHIIAKFLPLSTDHVIFVYDAVYITCLLLLFCKSTGAVRHFSKSYTLWHKLFVVISIALVATHHVHRSLYEVIFSAHIVLLEASWVATHLEEHF